MVKIWVVVYLTSKFYFVVANIRLTDEVERVWKEVGMSWPTHYSDIFLEFLRKTAKVAGS